MLEVLFKQESEIEICSVVRLPALNPACSSDIKPKIVETTSVCCSEKI